MNPLVVFWVPVVLRLGFLLAGAAVAAWLFGVSAGIFVIIAGLLAAVFTQLRYLYQASQWLDNPQSGRLPDGWGEWTGVFARLYRLRRDDEKNQAELTEWLARFRQAMHLLPDGVVIMDDVLFLEWCNPAAEEHLGLRHDRDKGMRVTNLVRSPDFMDYLILGRYDQPLTLSFRERKLIVHIIPFENRRQILVTHDITETQRAEMMRRDFIANASHELRTPLTVIVGFLEIAASMDLDAETRAAHLKLMMEQILHEGRALSGGKHTITLEVKGGDVMGSSDELHSAFGNLVSNAVRYTPAGGEIRIRWEDTATGVQFQVQDTGIGISPEHISRLTERFYRVDKSRSRETQGTGLGLAIVKHVLLRHSGKLTITSEAGHGSTFTVSLPKSTSNAPQPAEALPAPRAA
ncbi:MAG TPA: phosphate regulon sensor protein PhoR [Pseudoduganella sp.]